MPFAGFALELHNIATNFVVYLIIQLSHAKVEGYEVIRLND